MHWWYPEIKPFPRATTIAERIGIDIRTVQRALKRMEDELGLIRRVKRDASEGFSTVIELDGLVSRLNDFAKNDLSYNYRKREGLLPTLNAV